MGSALKERSVNKKTEENNLRRDRHLLSKFDRVSRQIQVRQNTAVDECRGQELECSLAQRSENRGSELVIPFLIVIEQIDCFAGPFPGISIIGTSHELPRKRNLGFGECLNERCFGVSKDVAIQCSRDQMVCYGKETKMIVNCLLVTGPKQVQTIVIISHLESELGTVEA